MSCGLTLLTLAVTAAVLQRCFSDCLFIHLLIYVLIERDTVFLSSLGTFCVDQVGLNLQYSFCPCLLSAEVTDTYQHMLPTVAHFVSKLRLRGVACSMTHSWCYLLFGYGLRVREVSYADI